MESYVRQGDTSSISVHDDELQLIFEADHLEMFSGDSRRQSQNGRISLA
jgi:hypothetical protein